MISSNRFQCCSNICILLKNWMPIESIARAHMLVTLLCTQFDDMLELYYTLSNSIYIKSLLYLNNSYHHLICSHPYKNIQSFLQYWCKSDYSHHCHLHIHWYLIRIYHNCNEWMQIWSLKCLCLGTCAYIKLVYL